MATNISAIATCSLIAKHICLLDHRQLPIAFIMFILSVILNSIFPLLTIFGNALVLLAFYCKPVLRTTSNLLILSMAVTNFLSALAVKPMCVYRKAMIVISVPHPDLICAIRKRSRFSIRFLKIRSCLTVSLMCAERYIANCHRLRYLTVISERKVKIIVCTRIYLE